MHVKAIICVTTHKAFDFDWYIYIPHGEDYIHCLALTLW